MQDGQEWNVETLAPGLTVNDDVWLEIVRPGSGDPLPVGGVGEIVVTALRGNFPLLRFATGDLSAYLDERRIRGWLGRADQTTKVKGMFVHPEEVVEALNADALNSGSLHAVSLKAELLPDASAIVDAIAPRLQSGDVVALLSNGGFDGIYEKLPARLRELHH